MLGCELTVGDPELLPSGGLPEGDFCVLPFELRAGRRKVELALAAPTGGLAPLARRLRGDEEPDKERELDADDVRAIGDVLSVLAGALLPGLRAKLAPDLALEPGLFWRTEEPGPALPEGLYTCARAELSVSGGGAVPVTLRLPQDILRKAGHGPSLAQILGLPEDVRAAIVSVLEAEGIARLEEGEETTPSAVPDLVFLDADSPAALDECRALRLADATWNAMILACSAEPSRELVLRALEHGASHVLALPLDARTLKHLLSAA